MFALTEPEVELSRPGVYVIRNTVNGRVYVGSAHNIRKRLAHHRTALTRGTHYNKRLQFDFDERGLAVFEFNVLEHVSADCLEKEEQKWIGRLGACAEASGYNKATKARRGKVSEETRRKRGRDREPISESHRLAIVAAWKSRLAAFGATHRDEKTTDCGRVTH